MAEVELRSVAKRFGSFTALHNVDLAIHDNQLTVLLGPSGCGKSTLLRLIAGLEDISEGEIVIAGNVVNDVDASRRGCAMVFQNYALYPHKTVADNIAFPLRMAGVPREKARARVKEVADVLELGALLHRLPRDLSGGQRQRVAMGRAMIREPSVYLFDEPLSNLDAELRVKMRLEISRLRDRLSATMIFVTHDQVEAMTLAHRVVVMSNGKIEQVGSPLEVYERPANRFVAGFIGTPAMSFLPVEAMEQNGAGRRLTLAGGASLDVPYALPDRPASIGVRPEHARLGEPGHGRPISIKGRLEALGVEHLGDRSHAFLAGPFGEITVLRAESDKPLDPDLPLTVNVDKLHYFDAEGRRVRIGADT